jgi:hypothetical protein
VGKETLSGEFQRGCVEIEEVEQKFKLLYSSADVGYFVKLEKFRFEQA